MGAQDTKKRKRNRKARTEVSSSSSSEDETFNTARHTQEQSPSMNDAPHDTAPIEPVEESDADEPIFHEQMKAKPSDSEQKFGDFYLRQATKEFADDLEKLRSAPDFDEKRSVPILIDALRQGTQCFGSDEGKKIGAAASTAK